MKYLFIPMILMLTLALSPAFGADTKARSILIIDVRTESEWNAGHLEGAILIPHERIGQEITRFTADKKTKIYLYCRSGRRTGLAFDTLSQAGYENLENLRTMENAAKRLNRAIVK